MLAMSLVNMTVAGGDYWRDYLLQPIPALALGAGLLAPLRTLAGRAVQVCAAWAAVAALVATGYGTWKSHRSATRRARAGSVGGWRRTRRPRTPRSCSGKATVLYHAGDGQPLPVHVEPAHPHTRS